MEPTAIATLGPWSATLRAFEATPALKIRPTDGASLFWCQVPTTGWATDRRLGADEWLLAVEAQHCDGLVAVAVVELCFPLKGAFIARVVQHHAADGVDVELPVVVTSSAHRAGAVARGEVGGGHGSGSLSRARVTPSNRRTTSTQPAMREGRR